MRTRDACGTRKRATTGRNAGPGRPSPAARLEDRVDGPAYVLGGVSAAPAGEPPPAAGVPVRVGAGPGAGTVGTGGVGTGGVGTGVVGTGVVGTGGGEGGVGRVGAGTLGTGTVGNGGIGGMSIAHAAAANRAAATTPVTPQIRRTQDNVAGGVSV
jgi:hypothetical protein